MFCSNCGLRHEKHANFCVSCGTQIQGQEIAAEINNTDKAMVVPSDFPKTVSNNKRSPIGVVIIVAGIAAIFGLVLYSSIDNQRLMDSGDSEKPKSLETEAIVPFETQAACEYLIPVIEEYAASFGNNVSDRTSDEALASLLLAVRKTDREFDVRDAPPPYNGMSGRGTPLYLQEFGSDIETTILMTFSNLDNSLEWANFVDSLYSNVVEPCSQVGVIFEPPLN